jgi:hypothetical protein
MIQPEKIKQDALRWYFEFLSKSIDEQPFFPKDIRFGKVKPSETLKEFASIRKEIENLRQNSKDKTGYGYQVVFIKVNDRKIGEQFFPDRIFFENRTDYLKFIKKEREFERFTKISTKIITELPLLKGWIIKHPKKVIENFEKWDDLIKVCIFFINHPKPCIYIRELPLNISTKFVEENQSLLRMLLDILIEPYVNSGESDFEKRFNLKYKERLIRIRLLDERISKLLFSGVNDLSIPFTQFETLNIPCKKAFIFENHTNFSNIFNFLTLPGMADSIAIFGEGFQIGLLKNARWLSDKQIIYWGDIDAHGFQILSQIRGYFPKTQSCMMDFSTYNDFQDLAISGVDTTATELSHLTPEEHQLFNYLRQNPGKNRLEQEKIPHSYAIKKILEITE